MYSSPKFLIGFDMESAERIANFLKLNYLLEEEQPPFIWRLSWLPPLYKEYAIRRVLSILATLEMALQTKSYSFERDRSTERLLATFLVYHEAAVRRLATPASLAYLGRYAEVPVKTPAVAHSLSFGQISQILVLIEALIFESWSEGVIFDSFRDSEHPSIKHLHRVSLVSSKITQIFHPSTHNQRKRDLDLFIRNWYLTTLTDESEKWPYVPTMFTTWECARPFFAGSTRFLCKVIKDVKGTPDTDPQNAMDFEAFQHVLLKLDAPAKPADDDAFKRIKSWAQALFYRPLA